MNREKQQVKEVAPKPKKEKKKNLSAARNYLKFMSVFGIFSKESAVKIMPYIFFLTVVALVYIANSYHAERTIRNIDSVSKELKTLRTEYITGKSELMFVSKQTEVARLVSQQGIKESVEAPLKIIVQPQKSKTAN